MNIIKAIAVTGLTSLSLAAVNASAEDSKPFAVDAELGIISTSGNTDSQSFIGKFNIKQELKKWRNEYIFESLYKRDTLEDETTGEEESETTAHKYFVSARGDLKLDDKYQAIFFYGSYEDDRFSGFEYQATLAVGYADRLFETTNSHFDYAVGPGIGFTETEDTDELEGESEESFIIRVSMAYQYQFSKNAKFTQTLSSDIAGENNRNTKTKAESAISANLNSSLALKASFLINHNSEVADDVDSTDTQTALTLVYSF